MRRLPLALVTAAPALAAAIACSGFSSTDEPEADAGAEASDDASGDRDAGTRPDGAVLDADCSWFCDDFEGDSWPGAGWAGPDIYQAGTIARVNDASVSPTHGLQSWLPDEAGFGTPKAVYSRVVNGADGVHCEVRARVDEQATDVALFMHVVVQTSSGETKELWFSDNGFQDRIEANEPGRLVTLTPFGKGTWVRFGIDYHPGRPTVFTLDGEPVNNPAASPAADGGPERLATVTLYLGADRNAGQSVGGWLFAFDDVSCSVTK